MAVGQAPSVRNRAAHSLRNAIIGSTRDAVCGRGGRDARGHARNRQLGRCVGLVAICVGAGLLFGNVPIVKQNFSLVTIGIVAVSPLPVAIEMLMRRSKQRL
jgi:hypothetical protein